MKDPQEPAPPMSAAAREFADQLERAAATDVTVLILGEHGSGKSYAARRLHRMGRRREEPLVEVDLVTLAPALVEAELFGHEEGAFTGAASARAGRFRRANGGTLVLEDIERLPIEMQVKLLRVLQERVVEPVGSEHSIPIDVRVVATTSLSLEEEVEAGRFRQDLYWRLAVLGLMVPPLRSRPEDLPALAQGLLEDAAQRVGVAPRALSEPALGRLLEHPWPGNVRELENALERVLVLAPAMPESCPEPAQAPGSAGRPVEAHEFDFLKEAREGIAERMARQALAHGLTLEAMEAALMAAALEEQRGNHSAAARQIGLSRRAFEYRRARREKTEREPSE